MSLPKHLSHSQLGGWLRCQKAFQLERIQRAPKTPAWWLVGGSTVHEVTEDLDRRTLAGEFSWNADDDSVTLLITELTREKLAQLIALEEERSGVKSEEWFAAGRSPGQGHDYWWKNAPGMVENWLKWRAQKGWSVADLGGDPGIEYEFELNIGETIIRGAPDRVLTLPNGEQSVVDIKSGSSTPKEPLQLGLYATALEVLGFQRPKYGTFVKVKDAESTPLVPLGKYDYRYFTELFAGLRGQLDLAAETGRFLPNVGDNCRTCSVQSSCFAYGGGQSDQYDPLDPEYQEGQAA